MFALQDENGHYVTMRDGKPFKYSSKELAKLGKRILDADRKGSFKIVAI